MYMALLLLLLLCTATFFSVSNQSGIQDPQFSFMLHKKRLNFCCCHVAKMFYILLKFAGRESRGFCEWSVSNKSFSLSDSRKCKFCPWLDLRAVRGRDMHRCAWRVQRKVVVSKVYDWIDSGLCLHSQGNNDVMVWKWQERLLRYE